MLGRLTICAGWLLAGAAQAQTAVFDNILQARYVHCAFYRAYDIDPLTGERLLVEGRSDTLTHFQGIAGGRARRISTRAAGAREVKVLSSGKYLHFLESGAGLYVLTTVYDCIDRDRYGVCVTYGAVQSRQFDARALTDPDGLYEALKGSADPGFCDHSFYGLQEAQAPSLR